MPGRCATSLSPKLASINNARRFVNSRPAGTRGRHVLLLRYPVTAAIAATCPVLYQVRSSCMV
ncbi:D-mannonate oxidoreductase, partial [Klebsiella pneumoniae]